MTDHSSIIKTERFLLRQLVENDIENVFKGLSDPNVIKYYGVSFDSLEATEEQMVWFADIRKNKKGIWWAICSVDGETFYGACGLYNIIKEHKKAEIGYWLLPGFWGQGMATEATLLICKYGFEKFNLHRIEASVEYENTRSKRVMVKSNFLHEGTMIDYEIKNGQFITIDIYAKINRPIGDGV